MNLHPHTDLELFEMFNVELGMVEVDGKMVKADADKLKTPLWKVTTTRKQGRGYRDAKQPCDHIRAEFSQYAPGSKERIEAMARHYGGVDWDTEETEENSSVFEI